MKVLVADEDAELLALARFALEQGGCSVVTVAAGAELLSTLAAERPHVVVIDADIAGAGLETCRVVRTQTNAPIMILSSRADEAQLVCALESGADDYLRKPFGPRTFVARVRALARRGPQQVEWPSVSVGPLLLDTMEHQLKLAGGDALTLTEFETRLLFMLMSRDGRKLSTEQLMAGVWGSSGSVRRSALKQLVYRVRKKLRALGATVEVQITHDGGYRLATSTPPVATR